MDYLAAALLVLSFLAVFVCIVVKKIRYPALSDRKTGMASAVVLMGAIVVSADMIAGGNVGIRLPFDAMLAFILLYLLTSPLWEQSSAFVVSLCVIAVSAVLAVCHILCAAGVLDVPSPDVFMVAVAVTALVYTVLFLTGVWLRVRNVRSVMKAGTVWAGVGMTVDAVYAVVIMSVLVLTLLMCIVTGRCGGLHTAVASLMLGGSVAALGLRVFFDSVFVFWHRQEKTIVESMKVSQMEVPNDGSRLDNVYRELYERIVELFEKDRPYLDSELTINDIVKVIYSNKVYISRAISQFTGRNFCQFVNYYRIIYAVEAFRLNPELKVVEMASMSGFNSAVSFNMAFRLYMNENPSDWCRRERSRLSKIKPKGRVNLPVKEKDGS